MAGYEDSSAASGATVGPLELEVADPLSEGAALSAVQVSADGQQDVSVMKGVLSWEAAMAEWLPEFVAVVMDCYCSMMLAVPDHLVYSSICCSLDKNERLQCR